MIKAILLLVSIECAIYAFSRKKGSALLLFLYSSILIFVMTSSLPISEIVFHQSIKVFGIALSFIDLISEYIGLHFIEIAGAILYLSIVAVVFFKFFMRVLSPIMFGHKHMDERLSELFSDYEKLPDPDWLDDGVDLMPIEPKKQRQLIWSWRLCQMEFERNLDEDWQWVSRHGQNNVAIIERSKDSEYVAIMYPNTDIQENLGGFSDPQSAKDVCGEWLMKHIDSLLSWAATDKNKSVVTRSQFSEIVTRGLATHGIKAEVKWWAYNRVFHVSVHKKLSSGIGNPSITIAGAMEVVKTVIGKACKTHNL